MVSFHGLPFAIELSSAVVLSNNADADVLTTVWSAISVKSDYSSIMHCDKYLLMTHNHEPVWLFEAKAGRRVRLAQLAEPAIGC